MFEYGSIRLIKLTSPDQASQLPQIIQTAITKFKSPYVSIKCWSALPKWERDNWMTVQPSKHLVLVNGYTHQGQWYEGDSHLSFSNPYALAECWRHYFSNQILDVTQDLWKDYHFMGSTERISVFGPRPYVNVISHIRIIDYCNPSSFSPQEKIQSLSRFYIVDSVINILHIMIMHAMMIPHGILMIATHRMLMILILGWPLQAC